MLLVHCVDKVGTEVCHWRISNGHQCRAPYMQQGCAASCRVCGMLITLACVGGRRRVGKSSRASHARLSPFPTLRTPATQVIVTL